jgi:hypothetical protein
MAARVKVFDCDGHIIESIPEMATYMDPAIRNVALHPSRNRQGVFAGLAYASDYPREVDLVSAKQMIDQTLARSDLSETEKEAVLGGNARKLFRM